MKEITLVLIGYYSGSILSDIYFYIEGLRPNLHVKYNISLAVSVLLAELVGVFKSELKYFKLFWIVVGFFLSYVSFNRTCGHE